MFERYIVINDAKILCGQTASGTWYCKELPANSTKEVDLLIGEINSVLNKYNKDGNGTTEAKTETKMKARV